MSTTTNFEFIGEVRRAMGTLYKDAPINLDTLHGALGHVRGALEIEEEGYMALLEWAEEKKWTPAWREHLSPVDILAFGQGDRDLAMTTLARIKESRIAEYRARVDTLTHAVILLSDHAEAVAPAVQPQTTAPVQGHTPAIRPNREAAFPTGFQPKRVGRLEWAALPL